MNIPTLPPHWVVRVEGQDEVIRCRGVEYEIETIETGSYGNPAIHVDAFYSIRLDDILTGSQRNTMTLPENQIINISPA